MYFYWFLPSKEGSPYKDFGCSVSKIINLITQKNLCEGQKYFELVQNNLVLLRSFSKRTKTLLEAKLLSTKTGGGKIFFL